MKNVYAILFLILLGLAMFAFVLRGQSGNLSSSQIKKNLDQATKPFELSPERSRYILIESLAKNHSFALTKQMAEAAYPDVGYYQGKYFIYFAPGVSIVVLPFYFAGQYFNLAQVASFFSISLFATASMVMLFLICQKIFAFPLWVSVLVPLTFAFASISLSYANTLYQHHVTTFLLVSSFYAAWQFRKRARFSFLYACYIWFAYGVAIFVDYPNAVLLLPVMVYFALSAVEMRFVKSMLQVKLRLWAVVPAVIFVFLLLLHGYYNYKNFGDFKTVSGSLVGVKEIQEATHRGAEITEADVAKIQGSKSPTSFFSEESFPKGLYTLTVSLDRGFLLYSPIFILALIGIARTKAKSNAENTTLFATILVNFFLYSSWSDPWGGWAYGPRYLIPSFALLSIYIGTFLTLKKRIFLVRPAFYVLFLYSNAIALLGALTTNAVPPKIEADYLHMKYNFLLNIDYLLSGKTSSFLFNEFFQSSLSIWQYYIILLMSMSLLVYAILFLNFSSMRRFRSFFPRLSLQPLLSWRQRIIK